jgi:hypothetical protein
MSAFGGFGGFGSNQNQNQNQATSSFGGFGQPATTGFGAAGGAGTNTGTTFGAGAGTGSLFGSNNATSNFGGKFCIVFHFIGENFPIKPIFASDARDGSLLTPSISRVWCKQQRL